MAITYATWNPSDKNANVTLSSGNLTASVAGGVTHYAARATIGKSSGKWYWEVTVISNVGIMFIGVGNVLMSIVNDSYVGFDVKGWSYYTLGTKYTSAGGSAYASAYTNGDVIGVALDMDAGTITMYKNNVSQGVMFNSLTGTLFPAISLYGASSISAKFGATAFTYSPPGGFSGLSTGTPDNNFLMFF